MRGRPTKLTPEVAKAILASVEAGIPYQVACEAQGLIARTMYNWRKKGEKDEEAGIDSDEARFFAEFTRARALSIQEDMSVLRGSDKPVWNDPDTDRPMYLPESALSARKWRMQCRMPHLFARPKQGLEISGPKGAPIQTVTNEEAIKRVRAIYGLDDEDDAGGVEEPKVTYNDEHESS